jgi:hypothetical protein
MTILKFIVASMNKNKGLRKPKLKRSVRKGMRPLREQKQVSAAAAYSTGKSVNVPRFSREGQTCRVVHRELLANVTSSIVFAARGFPLNPGLASVFPWLSIQARGWERYKFNRLTFRYYTRGATNEPGSVLLIPEYDPRDDNSGLTEQVASSYVGTVEDVPWKDNLLVCDHKSMLGGRTDKFVRQGVVASSELQNYDSGIFVIGTTGSSVTTLFWGKVWVEYDVTFYTPQSLTNSQAAVSISRTLGSTTSTAAAVFNGAILAGGLDITSDNVNTLTFNTPGYFKIFMRVLGTGLHTNFVPVVAASTAIVVIDDSGWSNAAADAGLLAFVVLFVQINESGQTVVIACNTMATTITQTVAYIGFLEP